MQWVSWCINVSTNLYSIAFLNINGVDYHCIINEIRKHEAINSLQKYWLDQKREILWNKTVYKKDKKVIIKFGETKISPG